MALSKYTEWQKLQNEGGAMRRAKRAMFELGTLPPGPPNMVNSGGSGTPFQVSNAEKVKTDEDVRKEKKNKKKKKSKKNESCSWNDFLNNKESANA